MIAYDDLFAIQYNRKNLRPYWRKDGWEAKDLLEASAKEYAALRERCGIPRSQTSCWTRSNA